MHVLMLEPFGGGSHAAFCAGWQRFSRHNLQLLQLPAVHWKWRSRHASLSLAVQANRLSAAGNSFDCVVCSDMLNLPEWLGLVGKPLNQLPRIVYFHENQFTYPLSEHQARDYHLAYSNILSLVAADEAWFNSDFHRREFEQAAVEWLKRMPDYAHLEIFQRSLSRARVLPPGIAPPPSPVTATPDHCSPAAAEATHRPPVVGWVARWEHDKRPDKFSAAIEQLIVENIDFEIILLGQQFRRGNESLRAFLQLAGSRVRHHGFATSQADYWRLLSEMDWVVSTADHEFFGIGVVEAVWAGALPLLPQRLAYPEVLGLAVDSQRGQFFYDGSVEDLVARLRGALRPLPAHEGQIRSKQLIHAGQKLREHLSQYHWEVLADRFDSRVEEIIESPRNAQLR